jgi:catechol 2,3-dioxygenase-like lactoylglutathione lyase family enzyme
MTMDAHLDHVVLWVSDPLRSVAFYEEVLRLEPLRVDAFREGKAPFPSVRISGETIIDLMPMAMAAVVNAIPGAAGSAGHRVNHLCLSMSKDAYEALRGRLIERGQPPAMTMQESFGAQGHAPEAFYFGDPDGNVLEARYYD